MGEGQAATATSYTADEHETPRITPLHIALWNGNLEQIDEALHTQEGALETRDPRGNRALHLALKFAHRNSKAIVKKLLNAGARVRSRDSDGWKTVHHAIAAGNEDILRILIQKEKAQAPGLLHKKINDAAPRLADIPDFCCEILVDVSTWIPGVSRLLPSDTVKIWKLGEDLRFDITLVGFDNGHWQRGNLSFLLLGRDHSFFCLDNDEKTCVNLLSPGELLQESDLDSMVHFLMTTTIMTTDVDVDELHVTRKHHWLTNTSVVEDIGKWARCGVYEMSGMVVNLRIRRPQNKNRKAPLNTLRSSTAKDALAVLHEVTKDPYALVSVDPKAEHIVSVELTPGETLKWRFAVESLDIQFSVGLLTEVNDEGEEQWQQIVAPQRISAKDHEQVGQITAQNNCTAILKWDNRYSLFRQKRIKFQVVVSSKEDECSDDNDWDSHQVTEKLVSFSEWFGTEIEDLPENLRTMRPKHRIMVHEQPPCRTMSKTFSATVFMNEAFPLSVNQFLPVIEVLSKTTSAFENVREFFNANLEGGFPVQFCFPLVPSVSATFRFMAMELCKPEPSMFRVPAEYALFHEDVLSPRTHHEMLQNLTAV